MFDCILTSRKFVLSVDQSTLPHGLYRLHWKEGGNSLAAVGSDKDGRRWYAPTNWVGGVPCTDWSLVAQADLLAEECRGG